MNSLHDELENEYADIVESFYGQTSKIIDDTGSVKDIEFSCSVLAGQGRFLYDLVRKVKPSRSLEIGLAWGGSTIHILCGLKANGGGHHIAIDPFQDGWSNIGVRETARLGLGHLLECRREKSETVLPRLLAEEHAVQFAFIDGDHRFDAVMNDFFYIQKLLEIGGVLVFDDAAGYSIGTVTSFIDSNMRNLERIPAPHRRFAAYRKVDKDRREIGYSAPFASWMTDAAD